MTLTQAILHAHEVKMMVLLAGSLTVFPAILVWGWVRCGVSPMDLYRAARGR